MTKETAIKLMKMGHKITHENFPKNLFITMKEDHIYTYNLTKCENFWKHKTSSDWNDGYSIFERK